MLVTIVAMWAVVIPLVVLGVSWQAANRRDARAASARSWSAPPGAARLRPDPRYCR
jgi:hypothetical protein